MKGKEEINSIKVKICGIKDLGSAEVAVEAGTDYVGFNFVKSSRRYIEPKDALKIAKKIRGKVMTVGVFQNEDYGRVNEVAQLLGLDFVQLHGDEDEGYVARVKRKVIKKFSIYNFPNKGTRFFKPSQFTVKSQFLNANLAYLLLDREVQGLGETVDLEKAREIAERIPVFLAGGLKPDNVGEIVRKVRPFAVDVAGGVEIDGKKDAGKMREFIKNVKGENL
jgi:phosphoribosylanthranilate isomerase